MNQRTSIISWVLSLVLLLICGGSSWVRVTLIPEAGSQILSISGFGAFSVSSALILLQGAAVLATLLTRPLVGRFISGALIPLMLWHLFDVTVNRDSVLQSAVSNEIADLTGLSGLESQADLVVSSVQSFWWIGYLLAILLNLAILILRSARALPAAKPRGATSQAEDSQGLWESQRPS